jgi:hypothetical protein
LFTVTVSGAGVTVKVTLPEAEESLLSPVKLNVTV